MLKEINALWEAGKKKRLINSKASAYRATICARSLFSGLMRLELLFLSD